MTEKNKWYNNYKFPLYPKLELIPADKYNTSGFSFNWLFMKIWSLDSFEFEIGFTISEHWGVGIIMIIPYLRIICCIPLPYNWAKILTRKSQRQLTSQEIRKKKLKRINKPKILKLICWSNLINIKKENKNNILEK